MINWILVNRPPVKENLKNRETCCKLKETFQSLTSRNSHTIKCVGFKAKNCIHIDGLYPTVLWRFYLTFSILFGSFWFSLLNFSFSFSILLWWSIFILLSWNLSFAFFIGAIVKDNFYFHITKNVCFLCKITSKNKRDCKNCNILMILNGVFGLWIICMAVLLN